jgi:CheY-like chemotaxis protein
MSVLLGWALAAVRGRERALQESDRRKDQFLATLSHELRNPLAPIRNGLHLLRLSDGESPDKRPVHEMLDRQLTHLVRLTDDLLELARVSRGHIELQRESVPLADAIQAAVEANQAAIAAAGQQLTLSLPPAPVVIDGDRIRLAQIFGNLLNNAARHAGTGAHITVSAHVDERGLIVRVRDDGAGITPASLPGIFDGFNRLDGSRNTRGGGLGIGLALVRQLVELHGGSIEAGSEGPGRGSEFTVRLPLRTSGRPATPETPGRRHSDRIHRILVVDDNQDHADSLAATLRLSGSEVRTAYSGRSALHALKDFTPTAAILDIGMPDMDGYQLAREIRRRLGGITLIALTGWGQAEDSQRSREAGFDHHLTKPARPGVLEDLLAPSRNPVTSPTTP